MDDRYFSDSFMRGWLSMPVTHRMPHPKDVDDELMMYCMGGEL